MENTANQRNTGIFLIILGVAFVVMRLFFGFSFMSLLWPLWVLVPGALMLFTAFNSDKAQPGWAVPGAVVGGTGAILFLLNLTGRWEAWSYMWAMYPIFVGSALYHVGKRNQDEHMQAGGKHTLTTGLYLLVGFGLFFELMVFGGFAFLDSALLPLLLISAGLYFLFGSERFSWNVPTFNAEKRKRELPADPVTGINPALRQKMDKALYEDEDSYV